MAPNGASRPRRRLVVNADDFGRSSEINEAVVRAHRQGILTTASLMVNEAAAHEAVRLARENPRLGIGLHLTLCSGRAGLLPELIPGLADRQGRLKRSPVGAGCVFFLRRGLRSQLRAEIHEQFAKFSESGLVLDHVNGHLHLHLHPVVLRILAEDAPALGLARLRLTNDPLRLDLRLSTGRWVYRLAHALVFTLLTRHARPILARSGFAHTQAVFGLLRNGRVDEDYVLRLLPELPEGDSELYSHPSLPDPEEELQMLLSARVRALADRLNIQLIRYQDL